MTNKTEPPASQYLSHSYIPAKIPAAMQLLLFGRHKKEPASQQGNTQETPPKQKQRKLTGTAIAKYEIAEEKVKFYAAKGFFKKRWVVVKEFPVSEVSAVESVDNWISLTWNGAAYSFILKKKAESFAKLCEQIQSIRDEGQKKREKDEYAALRKSELLGAINASLPIVDSSFDILMGLHEKRVNWTLIDGFVQRLGSGVSFKGQTLAPLELDFGTVTAAVKAQSAKETSKEAFAVIKAIHGYFNGLKPEADLADVHPSFEQAKVLVLAYLTLNDLLLAKIVGEKDSKKEFGALELQLADLANQTSFKVNVEDVKAIIDGAGAEAAGEGAVADARALFKERLNSFKP